MVTCRCGTPYSEMRALLYMYVIANQTRVAHFNKRGTCKTTSCCVFGVKVKFDANAIILDLVYARADIRIDFCRSLSKLNCVGPFIGFCPLVGVPVRTVSVVYTARDLGRERDRDRLNWVS